MRFFIFNQNLINDEKKLRENLDNNLKYQGIIFAEIELLKEELKNKKAPSSEFLEITGGDGPMKYRGISIIKHKNCNTWYARYRANGKQYYISAKTQKDCYEKLKIALKKQKQEEVKQLKEPTSQEPKSITFIEWYDKWIELYKQNVKQGTKNDYKKCLRYLKNIENMPITEIKSLKILEELNKIPFERTKQKTYEFLNAIFNKALVNEIITKNPMLVIDKPKHKRINGNALTNEDEKEFERLLIEKGYDLFLVCLYQGLRKGEMLALTIDDIDFNKKTISINKSINRFNEVDSTKNIYSTRVVPLFDKTEKILEKYKNKEGRLFNIAYQTCENKFKDFIAKYFQNKKYTIHSLRHTFITRCQEANVPLHIIQKWVGHTIGSSVTTQVYTHAREQAEIENIDKLNNYMDLQ